MPSLRSFTLFASVIVTLLAPVVAAPLPAITSNHDQHDGAHHVHVAGNHEHSAMGHSDHPNGAANHPHGHSAAHENEHTGPEAIHDLCPLRHHAKKVKRSLAARAPRPAKDVKRTRRLFHATTATGKASIEAYGVELGHSCLGDFGAAFYMSDSLSDALALISSIYPSEPIYVLEFEWRPSRGMLIGDTGVLYSETWNYVTMSVGSTGQVPQDWNVDMIAGGMGGHEAPQYAARTQAAVDPQHLVYIRTHGPYNPPKSKAPEPAGDTGFPDDGPSEPLTFGKKQVKKSGGSSGLSSGLKKKHRH